MVNKIVVKWWVMWSDEIMSRFCGIYQLLLRWALQCGNIASSSDLIFFPCLRSKNHNIGMLFSPVGHKPSSPKGLFLLLMVAYLGFLGSDLHEWYHKHSSLEQYKALFRATFPQPLVMSQRPLIPGLIADPGKWQQPWPGVGFTFCLWSHPKMLKLCLSRRV